MTILFLIHHVATLIMTGAIWLAQLSQYPLLAYVGRRNFIRYEHEHIRRISDIAWFIIYIELFTGIGLLVSPVTGVALSVRIAGFALIALIWAATWFVQYPIHRKLEHGFDPKLHRKLVRTNWIRTLAWTARAVLLTVVAAGLMA
jgi:hypothetical protein